MEPVLAVGIGGACGAIARFLFAEALPRRRVPVTTLIVNTLGSFLLGFVLFASFDEFVRAFVGVGLCGALTTYSTFSVQILVLAEQESKTAGAYFAIGSLVLGLFGFLAGWALATMLG